MPSTNQLRAAAPMRAASEMFAAPPTRQSRITFYLAAILLFTHFARPFDVVLKGYKLPAIICSICIVAVVLSGGLRQLKSRVGVAFLLMVGWMTFSVPLSYWKGGSFTYVLWFLQFFLPLMLLVAAASQTAKDIVKLSAVLAFSCCCHLILNGGEVGGRYSLNGTFGNSDDVALLAGFTIPFLVLSALALRNHLLRYLVIAGGTGYLLVLIGRTATRAAIPALIAMLGVYFLRGRGAQKIAIIIFAVVGVAIAFFALPTSAIERLATIVDAVSTTASPTGSQEGLSEAEASTMERRELLQDAITAALQHPVLGIGAGMFVQYRYDVMLRPDGTHKPYLPAHNTYLEVASECGLPGLLLYLFFLAAIWLGNLRTRRYYRKHDSADRDLMLSITVCVEAALVYFAACALFMTCDKHPHQFVLAGLVIAMQRILLERARETAVTTFPAPSGFGAMTPASAGVR